MNFLQIIHVLPELFSDTDLNNFYYSIMRIIPDCEIWTCVWYFQYELRVLEEFASQMSKLMPVKQEVDMSSLIMAPMPGVLKSVAVKPGDMVMGATVGGGGGRCSYTCIRRDEYFFNSFKGRKGFDQFAFVHIKTIINQLFYGNKKILWDLWGFQLLGIFFIANFFCFRSLRDRKSVYWKPWRCRTAWPPHAVPKWVNYLSLLQCISYTLIILRVIEPMHFYKHLHKVSLGDGYWIEGSHSSSKGYNCKIEKKMLIDSFLKSFPESLDIFQLIWPKTSLGWWYLIIKNKLTRV